MPAVPICTARVSSEAIDHQPRHAIAFGVEQPVEGLVINCRTQRQRPPQPGGEEIAVDRHIAIVGPQPDRNQALGIEIAGTEGAPVFAAHIDHRTGAIALAASSMRISLEKIQGEPVRARRPWAG